MNKLDGPESNRGERLWRNSPWVRVHDPEILAMVKHVYYLSIHPIYFFIKLMIPIIFYKKIL